MDRTSYTNYIGWMAISFPVAVMRQKLLDRSEVMWDTGCREWKGAKNENGYGRVWDGERLVYAHRAMWETEHGPIPLGMSICHSCDNPKCIDLDHLFCATHQENMKDCDVKRRRKNGAAKMRGQPSPVRGEKHGLVKISETDVRAILTDHGDWAARAAAEKFNISISLVYGIRAGRNWGWLKADLEANQF